MKVSVSKLVLLGAVFGDLGFAEAKYRVRNNKAVQDDQNSAAGGTERQLVEDLLAAIFDAESTEEELEEELVELIELDELFPPPPVNPPVMPPVMPPVNPPVMPPVGPPVKSTKAPSTKAPGGKRRLLSPGDEE